ncbi:MAG: ABC transporter permease, partial [Alistipes sp.]|nr:ABC transporter permease [Alistipes sp.]
MNKTWLIISHEYGERVRKKSFIITTLLMPIFMIALMIAPTLMMLYATGDQKQIVVLDRSGRAIVDRLQPSAEVSFIREDGMSKAEACNIYGEESGIFGVLYIGSEVEMRDSVQLITNSSSSMMLEENIAAQISDIIEKDKLAAYNIENLDQILADVETRIELST